MGLGETILAVGAGERPASFEQFSAAIDPAWIAEALAATGTASVRRRQLPAGHVGGLLLRVGLFPHRHLPPGRPPPHPLLPPPERRPGPLPQHGPRPKRRPPRPP